MTSKYELTPDQLANLVAEVFQANGHDAVGLELLGIDGERVGFVRAVVHIEHEAKPIEVYPKPRTTLTRQQLNDLLYPDVNIGNARLSGAGNGAA